MGKKSKKQKKAKEVVYTSNSVTLVPVLESKNGTDYMCDESASTTCQSEDQRDSLSVNSCHHPQKEAPNLQIGVRCRRPSHDLSNCDTGLLQLQMPAMPAVANGEHVETFSSVGKNGTAHDEIGGSVEMQSAYHVVETRSEADESKDDKLYSEPFNGKQVQNQMYKPCPKSMSSKESIWNSDSNEDDSAVSNLKTQEQAQGVQLASEQDSEETESLQVDDDGVVDDVESKEKEAVHEENNIEGNEKNQGETNDVEPEQNDNECILDVTGIEKDNGEQDEVVDNESVGALEDGNDVESNGVGSSSDLRIQESDEPVSDKDGCSDHGSGAVNEPSTEGIVCEPEDYADKSDEESTAMSDADVTISSLDFDESGSKNDQTATDTNNIEDVPEAQAPLVEFPTDSPVEDQPAPLVEFPRDSPVEDQLPSDDDDSDVEGSFVADVVNESLSTLDEVEEAEIADEVKDMPTHFKETKYLDYSSKAMDELVKDKPGDFSFGRTLRTMSGRKSLRVDEAKEISHSHTKQSGDSVTSTNSSMSSIFSFNLGKRKLENREDEDDLPEQDNKRVKAEEGVEPQGFFAKLTSPVINRLRGIKVGLSVGSSRPGEEVNGHEEMAVALIAPPPSKRCIVM